MSTAHPVDNRWNFKLEMKFRTDTGNNTRHLYIKIYIYYETDGGAQIDRAERAVAYVQRVSLKNLSCRYNSG